jgi:hypothetical protein
MVLWGLIVIATLLLATNIGGIAASLKITSLTPIDWAIVVVAALVSTFWIELMKIWRRSS